MQEHLLNRDFVSIEVAQNVLAERIAVFQLPLVFEKNNSSGGKRFGDGGNVEPSVLRIGDPPLRVGKTVGLAEKHVAALGHEDGTGEVAISDVGLNVPVELVVRGLRRRRNLGGQDRSTDHDRKPSTDLGQRHRWTPNKPASVERHSSSLARIRSSRRSPTVRINFSSERVTRPSWVGRVQIRWRVK